MMTQTYKGFTVHDDVDLGDAGSPAELAALERWKGNHELTTDERRHLDAWTTRQNLDNAIAFLKGKTPADYFGEGATIDQVHGQAWTPDVCEGVTEGKGCVVHQVWDHRLREEPEKIVHHPHHQHRLCERHAHLEGAHQDHHETLVRECQHKEAVMSKITDTYGLEVHERPVWRFDAAGTFIVDTTGHPKLSSRHVREIVNAHFADAAIKVI